MLSVFLNYFYFQESQHYIIFLDSTHCASKIEGEKYYFWTQFLPLRKAFPFYSEHDKIYFPAKLPQPSSLDTISNTIKFNGRPKFRLLILLLYLLEIISLKIIMSSDDFLFPLKSGNKLEHFKFYLHLPITVMTHLSGNV